MCAYESILYMGMCMCSRCMFVYREGWKIAGNMKLFFFLFLWFSYCLMFEFSYVFIIFLLMCIRKKRISLFFVRVWCRKIIFYKYFWKIKFHFFPSFFLLKMYNHASLFVYCTQHALCWIDISVYMYTINTYISNRKTNCFYSQRPILCITMF